MIAALIGDDTNPADQIADRAIDVAALTTAKVFLLSAKPGKIAFFFGFLFEAKLL